MENYDWPHLIQTFGLPLVLLFALCIGIYKFGTYVITKIAEPLVARVIKLLDKLEEALEKIIKSAEDQSESLKTAVTQSEQRDSRTHEFLIKLTENLDKLYRFLEKYDGKH